MKGHNKSRNGCTQCKKRKVKCSQTLPVCSQCQRRNEDCSYLGDYPPWQPQVPRTEQSRRAMGYPSPVPELPGRTIPYQSHLVDLELTHFYLTETYHTLWSRPECQITWRNAVFQRALTHPALMDGVLATAALHKITLGTPKAEGLKVIALQKQRNALSGLIPLLNCTDFQHWEIAMPLSLLVSIWAFASRNLPADLSILSELETFMDQQPDSARNDESPVSHFIQLVRRVQPMRHVATSGGHFHTKGELAELVRPVKDHELPDLPVEISAALDDAERQIQRSPGIPPGILDTDSKLGLKHLFRVSLSPDWLEMLVGWLVGLPEPFMEELRSRNPAALTFLAYWAACFHALDGRWWVNGWAMAIVDEVSKYVDGQWAKSIEWIKAYINTV